MDTDVKSVSILVETGDGRKKGRYGLDKHWSGVRDVQWKLLCFRPKHSYHFSDLRCQASHWLVAQLWRSLTIWNADRAFYAWTLCRQRIRVSECRSRDVRWKMVPFKTKSKRKTFFCIKDYFHISSPCLYHVETVCLMKRRIGASLPQKWYANCEHLFTTTRNKTYKSLCVHNFNRSSANCSACSPFYDILHATQACGRCFFFVFARLFGRVLPTTQSSQCSGAAASWVCGVT